MTPTELSAPPTTRLSGGGSIGVALVGLFVASVALGLVWLPSDPLGIDVSVRLQPPSRAHWLGSDEFGRDVFSRAVYAAQVSGAIAAGAVALATLAGVFVGVLAGFMRGWIDRALMLLNDALLAFPGILLALGLTVVFGATRKGIVLALGLAYFPSVVRVVRSSVLSLRERQFVEASRVMGNNEIYTMLRHVLPHTVAPVAVLATSMFGWALLSESALSFLGVGVGPPTPTWGNMLAAARPHLDEAPWLGIVPGAFIATTLLGVNLLGDAIRDRLDPRGRA